MSCVSHKDLESRIHDYEDEGCHEYWTPQEYDRIVQNLDTEMPQELPVSEEVQQENLFTEFDSCSENEGESEAESDSGEESDTGEIEFETINARGVKSACPFNDLASFHCVKGFPPDILHDVMEGVIPEDLLSIIRILSVKGWFTINQYNNSLERLGFTSHESGDKPYPVPTSKKVKKLSGKALSNLGKS